MWIANVLEFYAPGMEFGNIKIWAFLCVCLPVTKSISPREITVTIYLAFILEACEYLSNDSVIFILKIVVLDFVAVDGISVSQTQACLSWILAKRGRGDVCVTWTMLIMMWYMYENTGTPITVWYWPFWAYCWSIWISKFRLFYLKVIWKICRHR